MRRIGGSRYPPELTARAVRTYIDPSDHESDGETMAGSPGHDGLGAGA